MTGTTGCLSTFVNALRLGTLCCLLNLLLVYMQISELTIWVVYWLFVVLNVIVWLLSGVALVEAFAGWSRKESS